MSARRSSSPNPSKNGISSPASSESKVNYTSNPQLYEGDKIIVADELSKAVIGLGLRSDWAEDSINTIFELLNSIEKRTTSRADTLTVAAEELDLKMENLIKSNQSLQRTNEQLKNELSQLSNNFESINHQLRREISELNVKLNTISSKQSIQSISSESAPDLTQKYIQASSPKGPRKVLHTKESVLKSFMDQYIKKDPEGKIGYVELRKHINEYATQFGQEYSQIELPILVKVDPDIKQGTHKHNDNCYIGIAYK